MAIKRILLPLPGTADHASEIDMGLSAAKALEAHIEALYISEPLLPAVRRAREIGGLGYGYGRMPSTATAEHVDWAAEERERLAQDARERLARACAANGVPLRRAGEGTGALPAAAWRQAEGAYVTVAAARAAAFDLVVAASAAIMDQLSDIAEQSLLEQRRPVLLSPSRFTGTWASPAMVAWDESPECWHAVTAALPFLRLARSVEVVSVDRHADRRTHSQSEAVAYLACHGIAASSRVIAPDLRSVGDTLLAAAGDNDAGLLVMGAYSHSRLREMLLGGVTRHILKNAAARPVLLAH
jgi:nucleotide-binding universal stress UspA family protein